MATKDVYKWEENSDFTKCEAWGSREINCNKLTQELKNNFDSVPPLLKLNTSYCPWIPN